MFTDLIMSQVVPEVWHIVLTVSFQNTAAGLGFLKEDL
jgi:hypothetical protein